MIREIVILSLSEFLLLASLMLASLTGLFFRLAHLKLGDYGDDVRCLIPFLDKKYLNSSLVKQGPLSVTMVCGIPS